MKTMPTGSYIEGNSLLHKMDPFLKLLCIFVLFAAVICSDTFAGYSLMMIAISILIKCSGIGYRNALRGVWHMRIFFIIILFMNALFFETDHAFFSFWIFHVSAEGLIQGLHVILRVALAMILGNLLMSTTSPLDITGAIESLMYPLKYIGVPIQEVAMILSVALQFIPTFAEEADMIRKAQTARGARFESKNLFEKAQSVIPLVIPIFVSAFRRADELSIAMEARGYHRTKKKIRFHKCKFGTAEILFLLLCGLLCIVEIIL